MQNDKGVLTKDILCHSIKISLVDSVVKKKKMAPKNLISPNLPFLLMYKKYGLQQMYHVQTHYQLNKTNLVYTQPQLREKIKLDG